MANNIITITFTPCDPAPTGYNVAYRPVGSSDPFRTAGPFVASPIVINDPEDDPGTEYEGFLIADCEGTPGPQVAFDTSP